MYTMILTVLSYVRSLIKKTFRREKKATYNVLEKLFYTSMNLFYNVGIYGSQDILLIRSFQHFYDKEY